MMKRFVARPATVATACAARHASAFSGVEMGPPDTIMSLAWAFKADPSPRKVNLAIGIYSDDNLQPVVLDCVKEAQKRILAANHDMEYAPILGYPSFTSIAEKLAYGFDSPLIDSGRIASAQTLSGTGALRLAGDFLKRFNNAGAIYVPNYTWPNHVPIFEEAGLAIKTYSYFKMDGFQLDMNGMLKDLDALPAHTPVLFHVCAHNPCATDPTPEQWAAITEVVKRRNLLPVMDMAYQGFASGSQDQDSIGLRLLAHECTNLILCQSFAKTPGLYGHRCGNLSFITANADESSKVLSQLKIMIRRMYSSPPVHGSRIMETLVNDAELFALWKKELLGKADALKRKRTMLVDELEKAGSIRDWSHVRKQVGMMAFTGLTPLQIARLTKEYEIYMIGNGRIAITGVTTQNVKHIAEGIHNVTK